MASRIVFGFFVAHFWIQIVQAYDAIPRWGQAAVVIEDVFFVFGGKTDIYNSYSYTSAPNTNDLLFLSLSEPFDASSAPWELVSSSANGSTSQGPGLAWHSLSAFNTSGILLFGGQPDANSPTVLVDLSDSAILINVFNRLQPNWITEAASWAGEPKRRIHHSTATVPSGLIFIIGGEEADGSQNGFSDHWVFNSTAPLFTQLPSGGPPAIYGHASIILGDGRLLVFGGFSGLEGILIPFSTIYVLDTSDSLFAWTTASVSTVLLPSPRRAFAALLIGNGKILIHGGSDADLQNNFDDGWVLDTTQIPFTWTLIPALSQLGPLRDHSAVCSGEQVIFGFGYGNDGPANSTLQVYDIPSGSFVPSYVPPSPTAPFTATLPAASTTTAHKPPTSTASGIHPTSTLSPSDTPNGPPQEDNGAKHATTAIVIGTILGVFALVAVLLTIAYYFRRRHRDSQDERRFMAIGANDIDGDGGYDDVESTHLQGGIPVAGSFGGNSIHSATRWPHSILNSLGIVGASAARSRMVTRSSRQRRDMLADEDTREFGEWWTGKKRDGTGGSSWSLKDILAGRLSRTSSVRSAAGTTVWREKGDPFSDGASLMRDDGTGYAQTSGKRPQGRREMSYTSTRSGRSYVDPFSDPIQEERREGSHSSLLDDYQGYDPTLPFAPPPPPPISLSIIRPVLPLSKGGHALSPLSERTSQNTISLDPSSSASASSHDHMSGENILSHFSDSASRVTSRTSYEASRSPRPSSSIIGSNAPPDQPMRRSDSWWARFRSTNFLDRRSSDASRRSINRYDIRDPNPAPRLGAIEESVHSASPDQSRKSSGQEQAASRTNSRVMEGRRKSMSSVHTADSEAIERMAGAMDVIQRIRTGSHRTSGSTSTSGGLSIDVHGAAQTHPDPFDGIPNVTSPVEMLPADVNDYPLQSLETQSKKSTPSPKRPASSASSSSRSTRPAPGGAIAAKIQAYERRLSQDQEIPRLTNTKQVEERRKGRGMSVDYGLVPRASLFVANPDHRAMNSGAS